MTDTKTKLPRYRLALTGRIEPVTVRLAQKRNEVCFSGYGTPEELEAQLDEQWSYLRDYLLRQLRERRFADAAVGVPQGGARG